MTRLIRRRVQWQYRQFTLRTGGDAGTGKYVGDMMELIFVSGNLSNEEVSSLTVYISDKCLKL